MKQLIQRRPVAVFMVATMILTYPIGIAALIGLQPVQDMMPDWVRYDLVTGSVSRFAPTIVALILMAVAFGKASYNAWLRQLFRVSVSAWYYFGVFALIIFSWGFASYMAISNEGLSPSELFKSDLSSANMAPFDRLLDYGREVVYITLTNGEETGWRFFMTAVLLVTLRPFAAALVTWVLWSIWHAPILLLGGGGIDLIIAFSILLLPVTILAAWIYIRSESLFLLLLAHGVFNATTEYAFERQFPSMSNVIADNEAAAALYFAIPFGLLTLLILIIDWRTMFSRDPSDNLTGWARTASSCDRKRNGK